MSDADLSPKLSENVQQYPHINRIVLLGSLGVISAGLFTLFAQLLHVSFLGGNHGALQISFVLISLGLGLLTTFALPDRGKRSPQINLMSYGSIMAALLLGLSNFGFIAYSLFTMHGKLHAQPPIDGYLTSPIPPVAALNTIIVSLCLFLILKKRDVEGIMAYGVGALALFVFNLCLLISIGYFLSQPSVFHIEIIFPALIGFTCASLVLLIGTLPDKGLIQPLFSPHLRSRIFAGLAALAGLIILLYGGGSIAWAQLREPAHSLNMLALYMVSEIITVVVAVLLQIISFRAIYHSDQATLLAKREKEMNRKVELAKCQAELANARKTQLLNFIVHDLKNPIHAIMGYSDMLFSDLSNIQALDKQKRYVQNISDSGYLMLEMVNGLLDTARIEAGKIEFHPEWISVPVLFMELNEILNNLMQSKNVHLAFNISENLDQVEIDPVRLKQILLNLLSNAIRYNREHGVVLLKAYLAKYQEVIIFEVCDTGIGVSPENISNLFVEFYQENRHHAENSTGMGLAVTKSLVELQGGSISVKSIVEQGTTFIVSLPVKLPSSSLILPPVKVLNDLGDKKEI